MSFEGPKNEDPSYVGFRVLGGLIGIISGLYKDNGKRNGNYYSV